MPKRKDAREAKGADGGGLQKSDAEILKERRSLEAFDSADSYLGSLGWGLWALAGVWFFCFAPAAPAVPCLHGGMGDPLLGLVVCGTLCTGLSGCAPRGTWSAWRKLWHLVWLPALGLLGAAFAWASTSLAAPVPRGTPAPPSPLVPGVAVACCLAAVWAVVTYPGGEPKPARGVGLAPSRLICMADGVVGLAMGVSSALAVGAWSQPFGPAAVCVQTVPLVMCSLAEALCQTEAELLAAVPSAMLLFAGAAARSAFEGEAMAAVPMVAAVVLHCALYLPLPLQDPDSNPFNRGLRKRIERFVRFMQQPVSGFGDEGD